MRILYNVALYALLPAILLRLLYRSIKNPAYRNRISERFGLIKAAPGTQGIWVHAVSVGESVAAVKLVKALQLQNPALSITVTCGTPTGSDVIQSQLGAQVYHIYQPYDLPGAVKRFFARIEPSIGIIMEKELWPNLFHYAERSGVRMMIANALLSDHSYRRYQQFSSLSQNMFCSIDHVSAQTDDDAQKFIKLGVQADHVSVVGNLKYEYSEINASELGEQSRYRKQLADDRPIWLAGSTHEGEDAIIIRAHASLMAKNPDLLLIIVPRHPERFEDVFQLCKAHLITHKRSELHDGEALSPETQVLLVDSMGELNRFIAISDWCFIGGSLVPIGGHNILEACHAGVPVLFGPYMNNTQEIAERVEREGAGLSVANETELVNTCHHLMNHQAQRARMGQRGHDLIAANQGALSKTLSLLDPWLSSH